MATPYVKPVLLDIVSWAMQAENTFVQELDPAERSEIGAPDHWSAKDHIAHMTYWRRRLVSNLATIVQHQEIQTNPLGYEQLNPIIFEDQRDRPWPEIQAEAERVNDELLAVVRQLSEEDLTIPNRFAWHEKDDPLYTALLGNCFEHTQVHLVQYYLERHNATRAISIRETWAQRVIQAEVPDDFKGFVLYNLACFYALQNQLEHAAALLQNALVLVPRFKEWSLVDPDLSALR